MEIKLYGKTHQVSEGATGFDLFEDRNIVALRVNGELRDLAHKVAAGDIVEGIEISSPEGLSILRHSTAHLLAQAVQELYPQTRLGIGPPIEDGFYYDFDPLEPFTPEDLQKLEKRMKDLVGKSQKFIRREVTDQEAKSELSDEPYKLELISLKGSEVGEGSVEVSAGQLSVYQNVNPDGSVAWQDLCRGPIFPIRE